MAQSHNVWCASVPDVVPTGVCTSAEAHRAVAVEELLEESTAGQPHPAACVHAEICIQEQLVKYLDGENQPSWRPDVLALSTSVTLLYPQGARALLLRAQECRKDLLDPRIPPQPQPIRSCPWLGLVTGYRLACTHPDPALPADPEVPAGEEAGHSMPGQVVDPALLPQLGHDGVNPREACLALGPLGQGFGVAVPGDLDADGVPLHSVKPGVVGGRCVEEFSP